MTALHSALVTASMVSVMAACAPKRPVPAVLAGADGGAVVRTAHASDAGHDACADLTPVQRAMVVAKVGSETLTLCDFAHRLEQQNQYLRARLAQPEQRRALLAAWVDSEMLATEARTRGLDREPAVKQAVISLLARQFEGELRAQVPTPTVSDADVAAYFEAHRAEYETPAQVRASQIVLSTRALAERALAEARAHANDDAAWRALASRDSIDLAARASGGDLGYFTAQGGGTVAPEVAHAAFALANSGDVAAQVVESATGSPTHGPAFHVVRLTAKREALHRTLDEVRSQIQARLFRERNEAAQTAAVTDLLARLRTQAHVTVDEAALAAVHLDVIDAGPAAFPQPGPAPAPAPLPGAR